MPRFFVNHPLRAGETAVIDGADARHIVGALRMAAGETLTLCDGAGTDYATTITAVSKDTVTISVASAAPNATEPSVAVTLYMGMPKGDKLEFVIQKAVELGVTAVVPVVTARSIVRVSGKDAEKKQVRLQRIAAEAAGQSGRGVIPVVHAPIDFKTALTRLKNETVLLCYEGGGAPLGSLVCAADKAVSLVIGPEGGFAPEEVDAVKSVGGKVATLGPRILRCETAPLAALTVIMEKTGNMV